MQTNVLEYLEKGPLIAARDKIALVDGRDAYTFGEVAAVAKRCAALILEKTDAIRQPIAVFLPKSANTVMADLGIVYSGNAYLNLDVKSPAQRIKSILDSVEPLLVICSREHQETATSLGVEPDRIVLMDDAHSCQYGYDNDRILSRLSSIIDTDPLYIVSTSGSTGVPKGVVISHRGVIDYIDWARQCFAIDDSCVIGNQSPFYFDNSTLDVYLCLSTGSTLVIIPEHLFAFPVSLVEYVRSEGINFIFWVPSVMVNVANVKALDNDDLGCLKRVLFAGEVMPNRHLNYWRHHIPGALFANLYGPTEITVDCTYFIVDREFRDEEPLPIGFPCRNTDILILNESNQPAKVNEPGELYVRGSSLALGYWNDPVKTSQAFVQNPLNEHYPELIYRTGDLVHRNERGEIMFIGRRDHQIKHLGYRIELGEIEQAVLGLGLVDNACVLYYKETKEITLFFQAGERVSPATIRQRLSTVLPKYMLPTAFHQLDAMPWTRNGKIDRGALSLTFLEAES